MAQFYSGKDGVFLLSGTSEDKGYFSANNAKVVDWSITTSVDALETTTLRDKAKTYIPGVQESSGSANLLFYADGGTSLIYDILNGVTAKKDGTYTTERRYMRLALERGIMIKFACYITNCELSVSAGDIAKASIQFTVDGPIEQIKLNPTTGDLSG